MLPSEARRFRRQLNSVIDTLNDEEAFEVTALFPEWITGKEYYGPNDLTHPQSRVQYLDLLYKCLQTHTSAVGWEPNIAVSLWYEIPDPAQEWPEWKQPIGAGTGYPLGAKVSHNGKHWINVGKDDNEYEPGVWGWDEVIA